MDLFVDNSVIMMKLMKLMKLCKFSLFCCKIWTFSIKFSDQVFPDDANFGNKLLAHWTGTGRLCLRK